ncbi:TOMM precursor leader peptide-binding protein [Streptomyces tirandamycinicus]|uniref:TOMM precursor leader peptide-binding protein n=1 Tax=Streptomyces tirandamycinicus TaxID=2174846 RepID=UPI00226D8092|nr:TOMM precursor leader peptide-binding protein [Streptomyces tirandamycinicus]MCY0980049.1 TOMM precursor leader peptide-binding protein [Streptomyces tirandamycinicus]
MSTLAGDPGQRGTPAAVVAAAVSSDPQFRLPARPQLCRGLHVVDTPDGVVIDGGAERQHLRGASAAALRRLLLPLLDGSRDAAALARATGWSESAVHQAVATLYFAGVLEDAAQAVPPPEGDGPSGPAAVWMSRTLDCARVHPHSSHAALAAARARVRLSVRASWRQPLRTALADLGITDVLPLPPGEEAPEDALVVADLAAPRATVDRIVEESARRGSRLLLADERDGRVAVGPLVDPSATACAHCARAAVALRPLPLEEFLAAAPTPGAATAAGLIAEELRALLLRGEPVQSLGGQLVVDLADSSTTTYKLTPDAGCRTCYPTAEGRTDPLPDDGPLHYEHAVAFPPRHLVNPKAHQHHFRPENVGLQFERLRYPNNPRQPLPDASLADLEKLAAAAEPPPWPEALAALMRFTAGLRGPGDEGEAGDPGRVNRWAPTGGNLGSPHVYALLRGVPGLPDGVHYYDAADHALTAMHPHTDHLGTLIEALGGEAADGGTRPGVHLVLASDIGRVARKYGPFAYRVGNLDTGCALAQLALTARAIGLAHGLLDPHPLQRHRELLVGAAGPALISAAVRLHDEGSGSCR